MAAQKLINLLSECGKYMEAGGVCTGTEFLRELGKAPAQKYGCNLTPTRKKSQNSPYKKDQTKGHSLMQRFLFSPLY